MKNWRYLLFGLAFILLAFLVIRETEPSPPLLSITQTTGGNQPFLCEGIVKGIMIVQEIHTESDYINGLSIRFATMAKVNTNTNTILVLDSNYNVLHQDKFSSKDVEDTKYHSFQFRASRKTGPGNKLYICLFSNDGDSANCLHVLFNPGSRKGSLYASIVRNDDFIRSIRNRVRLYHGDMMLRTYESGISITSLITGSLYVLAILIALLIIFFKPFQVLLTRVSIRPEILYLIIALIFGFLFVFLNPPFQAPDEGAHLTRMYELSEFQFSRDGKTVPESVVKLDSIFTRLHFNPDAKTGKKEILGMSGVELNPAARRKSGGPDYTVPFLPQLMGLAIGKIFNPAPLIGLYFGRAFNLLLCIIITFLAIRIIPFSKWLFFMLALMPKTLYMMSSLSYDAFLICDSFLLIALLLYYAFKAERLGWRDIAILFVLSVLLAMCKPPYFLIGFLFLIIPVRKIGSIKKYVVIYTVIILSMFLAAGPWSRAGELIKWGNEAKTGTHAEKGQKTKRIRTGRSRNPLVAEAEKSVKTENPRPQGNKGFDWVKESKTEARPSSNQQQRPAINPAKQVSYLKTHPVTFLKLLLVTNFDHMRANMLNNFVDSMGWLDTFLPDIFINIYLVMLMIAALCVSDPMFTIDWKRKLYFFIVFIAGVVMIELAMYIYSSLVGQDRLYGIQGRYFIPIAPLFLLLFYNTYIAGKLNFILSPRRQSYNKAKPGQKAKILAEINTEQIFTKYMQLLIAVVVIVTLARSIGAILFRYYQW